MTIIGTVYKEKLEASTVEPGLIHKTFYGYVKSFNEIDLVVSTNKESGSETSFYFNADTQYVDANLQVGAFVVVEAEYLENAEQPYPVMSVIVKPNVIRSEERRVGKECYS